jgi:DNA repair exonuclease SbcCD ATPase subunit
VSAEETACRWAREIERLGNEQQQLVAGMRDARQRLQRAQASMDRLREKRSSDSLRQQELARRLQQFVELTARRRAEHSLLVAASTAARDALLELLPEASHGEAHEHVPSLLAEYDALVALDVPARCRRLQAARLDLAQLSGQLSTVQEQAAGIPAAARRSTAEVERTRAEADERQRELDHAREAAATELARLEAALQRRQVLAADLKRTDHEQYLWDRLVTLLGRNGLLRYLMRHAERAIVDYANEILDRLSAGQLFLELRGDDADLESAGGPRALDLLARLSASDCELQEVAFLSGSQKFRVAVSLSLAIGQYATQARRPVQAVIIDEGFGCLDTVNRQVMIQELYNLRNYLERVLIVSHQEEFAAAFPDGYHTEIVDGTTRLTRFHR